MRRPRIRFTGVVIAAAVVGIFILAVSHSGSIPKRACRIHSLNRVNRVVFVVSSTNAPPGNQPGQTP